ncbi:hypothetical protein DNTS_031737 [Danionella cerebrum]|uniref:Protein SAAL1 n=1 Tax=Danionella cerebrum TaxID=2873325 RepID=A0A553QBA2_9TELE|nr:hypothetical protein DNTS_031737 [Danionella translucida]
MDAGDRSSQVLDGDNSGSSREGSPEMDRNPSPPPDEEAPVAGEAPEDDAIGETLYSKHWLFSKLTRLIQMVTNQESDSNDSSMELTDELEEDLCKVWDMAMDKDVAVFLQEFKAPEILLGEICVGILGNMACFHDACVSLSQNSDLGAVLLLLLEDSDPPTLLETCRLLLSCVSQTEVAPLWLERIRQQSGVCSSLCFIMGSSTNVDLLVKVGELVHKIFDEDEDLMKSWLSSSHCENDPDVVCALLEGATQLRSESTEGLEVYLHSLQLLTTVEEGMKALAGLSGTAVWTFVCELLCEGLCQRGDPPLILQEQKALLTPSLSLLSALHSSIYTDIRGELLESLIRILQFSEEIGLRAGNTESKERRNSEDANEDVQLKALVETTAEFLAVILMEDLLSSLLKEGHLTEKSCVCALGFLLPQHQNALQRLVVLLSEVEPKLGDVVRNHFSISSSESS